MISRRMVQTVFSTNYVKKDSGLSSRDSAMRSKSDGASPSGVSQDLPIRIEFNFSAFDFAVASTVCLC